MSLLHFPHHTAQFLEDREAGFQREMLFCKLNSVMPRLRHPPEGRLKLKIYKCALVCEATVLLTAVMLNTHSIIASPGEAFCGLLLLLSLAEGPLQLEISGAPFRMMLLIVIHFAFAIVAMIEHEAVQLSIGLAVIEVGSRDGRFSDVLSSVSLRIVPCR